MFERFYEIAMRVKTEERHNSTTVQEAVKRVVNERTKGIVVLAIAVCNVDRKQDKGAEPLSTPPAW